MGPSQAGVYNNNPPKKGISGSVNEPEGIPLVHLGCDGNDGNSSLLFHVWVGGSLVTLEVCGGVGDHPRIALFGYLQHQQA